MSESQPYGGRLMFAQSWEDPECDRAALSIQPGDSLLAITSGGDNVLDLLRDDPARIVAIDINPAQAFLFELKRAAFRQLDHAGLLGLLGVAETKDAAELYRSIRPELSSAAAAFFDARKQWFDDGLLTQGGFERYFAVLRRIIRLAVGSATVAGLFRLDPSLQAEFYRRDWDGWRWRSLMRIGCSKALLGNRLDPSWFADSQSSNFGGHFLGLAEHALVALPATENYFLAQILLGKYLEQSVPAYLKSENFLTIRERIDRVKLVAMGIEEGLRTLPARAIDAFALSNVFEYSPAAVFEQSKDEIVRVARPGARLALRNLLAPRRFAEDSRFTVDADLSERLRAADRGFIYSRFEAGRLA